jgi:hypothetical protein
VPKTRVIPPDLRVNTCPIGADYPHSKTGDVTIYTWRPNPGACALDWDYLKSTNSMAYYYYAALPYNRSTVLNYEQRRGDEQDVYNRGTNCGRCIKVN